MKTSYTIIGEHLVSIQSFSGRFTSWLKEQFQINESPSPSVDLTLQIHEGYGSPFVDYQVKISNTAKHIIYRRADYLLKVNLDYRQAEIHAYDDLALKHALNNVYSAFIVYHRWGLLVHSSCVDHQGKAFLFAGPSGAGKSTVARLSAPRPLLSDEATLVKITESGITVFDSPFRSELKTPHFSPSCPLSGVYLLHQSLDVKTTLLSRSDALLNIMDKIFYWSHDSSETMKLFHLCKLLVEKVPVYRMDFQKNNSFWELIS
ncbi:hypothetical protein [Ammoniphilus sp. YIM 78166]|uniref:hypothetical protein n=1 Tax=Ammoniphilus sp. YIM 78166 TaxID=1644106 RepID=UPI00106FC3F5|nr:hypothetical protein [Ammoniphilus sp. YIM 78166]